MLNDGILTILLPMLFLALVSDVWTTLVNHVNAITGHHVIQYMDVFSYVSLEVTENKLPITQSDIPERGRVREVFGVLAGGF